MALVATAQRIALGSLIVLASYTPIARASLVEGSYDRSYPNKPLAGSERVFYLKGPIVDGLPVLYPQRQIWNGAAWVPIDSEDGVDARFGIRKIRVPTPE